MSLSTFRIFTPQEFGAYLAETTFSRKITFIQNHHTWKPSYSYLTEARGELFWLESMRKAHMNERKWSDIGQNITTFPSGNIALCRPLDTTPAGIYGANTGGICMEHFGNFDEGQDVMTDAHKNTIVTLNALLCKKFKLQPVKWQIVYHHWFDTKGRKFSEEKINNHQIGNQQKTCPGTDFFGGNTIADAEANFFPLIVQALAQTNTAVPPIAKKRVIANKLNVRSGAGKNNSVVRQITEGTEVSVYAVDPSGWSKISNTANEWVFSQLIN